MRKRRRPVLATSERREQLLKHLKTALVALVERHGEQALSAADLMRAKAKVPRMRVEENGMNGFTLRIEPEKREDEDGMCSVCQSIGPCVTLGERDWPQCPRLCQGCLEHALSMIDPRWWRDC